MQLKYNMKLLKPGWVSHGGKPIFSIDIHPDGSRFATGGQGESSGKVVIWNMAPVRCEKDDKDKNVPKVLCQMDHHLGCVNCVRWSNSGKYLASAGDDRLIMIWQTSRSGGVSTVFGSAGKLVNVEQWRVGSTLKGHSGDVLDVSWSPHDVWLASCSVDNSIIVWNALKFPEQVCVLRGHCALVKGVTWDPINKYLASQSDDRSLRIWRTLDWQEEIAVTQPFEECGGTTQVLRLDWSPDGYYVVSAHAMNNAGPTAAIVERDGWKCGRDFVGHRKAITVVRFNPKILSKGSKGSSEGRHYCCCAIGSRDRSISIWLTGLKRPLVVTHDLFTKSILDISWSETGMELLCCSWDGTVAFMQFSSKELGHPLSPDAKYALQAKTYGSCMLSRSEAANRLIETPAMLSLQQRQPPAPVTARTDIDDAPPQPPPMTQPQGSNTSTPSQYSPNKPNNKQIETRTRDGKRHITPIFLAAQPEFGDVPLPYSSTVQPTFSSSTELSQIVVEKKAGEEGPSSCVRSLEDAERTHSCSPVKNLTADRSKAQTPTSSRLVDLDKDADLTPKSAAVKRSLAPPSGPGVVPKKKDGRGRPRKDRSLVDPHAVAATAAQAPAAAPVAPVAQRIIYTTPSVKLPASKIDKSLSIQVAGQPDQLIEVQNGAASGAAQHTLRCLRAGKPQWDVHVASAVAACTANSEMTCVACVDSTILLFSSLSGRKICPNLVLEGPVSSFVSSGHFLMAITTKGVVFVWNIDQLSAVIKNESLLPIMPSDDVTLDCCQLTLTGMPLLSLSNGKCHTYMQALGCWVLLLDRLDRLDLHSDHHSCVPRSESSVKGPLASLQATQLRSGKQARDLYRASGGSRRTNTRAYLENQLVCARSLHSPAEFHFWLNTYVRYIVQQGLECPLRECCDDLLGPVCRTKSNNRWEPTILGHKKRDLLAEMLPIIASNLQLQRLFTEYQDQLDTVTPSAAGTTATKT